MSKLIKSLQYTVFSILPVLLFLTGCKNRTVIHDFNISNQLEDSVILNIYTNNKDFQQNYKSTNVIEPNATKLLASIVTDDIGGVHWCDVIESIDSVELRRVNTTECIFVWRFNKANFVQSGYESLHNWYDCEYWHINSTRIADNHGQSNYVLIK